jgi:hypothetical protein
MDDLRTQIISLIKSIANERDGKPPGKQLFESLTEIKESEWYPHLWLRWGDAIREAGLAPNKMAVRYDEEYLIAKYITLIQEIGRFPVDGELRRKAKLDADFPSKGAFDRLGNKQTKVEKLLRYSRAKGGLEDVVRHCENALLPDRGENGNPYTVERVGYVYLIQHGSRREFKIGFTMNTFRRHGEISVELPEQVEPVHVIKTDDPAGVEAYWHRRFSDKRKNGEWFALSRADVQAFKRWKRIC